MLDQDDVNAEGGEGERDVLPGEQAEGEHRPEQPVAVRQDRVEAEGDRRNGEGDVMEIEDDPGENAPEDEIGGLECERREKSKPLPCPPEDRQARHRQQHRLNHEQDTNVIPDPVERRDRHQDRMEMIAQQIADHDQGVGDHLQAAVPPDGLVLDTQVEGLAGEMIVAVDADGGVGHCRDHREGNRQDREQPLAPNGRCRGGPSHRNLIRCCFHYGPCGPPIVDAHARPATNARHPGAQ